MTLRRRTARATLISVLLTGLLLAACTGSSDTTSSATASGPSTASTGLVATAPPSGAPSVTAGGRIVFDRHDTSADTSTAFTIGADGTGERGVGTGNVSCTEWSSGAAEILCTAWLENGARPATANADGSGFRILDAYPGRKRSVVCDSWFSDGTRFLCRTDPDGSAVADRGLYVVRSSDGRDVARLTVTPTGCADGDEVLSPDGTEVLFDRLCGTDDHGTLFRVRVDGSHLLQFTKSDLSVIDNWGGLEAAWSPDGSLVAFSAQPTPNPADEPYTLFVMNSDGGGLRQIVSTDVGAVSAQWSPDGQWIAFTSKRRSDPQVWLVHPDGSGLTRLTDGSDGSTALAPIWSPDGMKLLFTKVTADRVSLWTIDATGSGRSQLTDVPNVESIGYAWGASAP